MNARKPSSFSSDVYELLLKVPKGKVTTYKELARGLRTRAYRAVGTAVGHNPYAPRVPCHRVVRSDGKLGNYTYKGRNDPKRKAAMLAAEGVLVFEGKIVDFTRILYRFR